MRKSKTITTAPPADCVEALAQDPRALAIRDGLMRSGGREIYGEAIGPFFSAVIKHGLGKYAVELVFKSLHDHWHVPVPVVENAEGWKRLSNARKSHFFIDGRSACGKWGFFGSVEDPQSAGSEPRLDDCKKCWNVAKSREG